MRRRYIEGSGWNWLDKYTVQVKHVDDRLSGYLSVVKIEKVKEKRIVRLADKEICLAADGYTRLLYLPDNQNWSMTKIVDGDGEVVEWYFDITKSNSIDEKGRPYMDDLYLDVVLLPNSEITILDEDELKAAFEQGEISKFEFDLAYSTCNKIIETIIHDSYLLELNEQYLK